MKRSKINQALKELEAMCQKYHCYLPPFCHFTPEQWQNIGHEYDEVRDCMDGQRPSFSDSLSAVRESSPRIRSTLALAVCRERISSLAFW